MSVDSCVSLFRYMTAPDRLYIIDRNGVVRYQGGTGPFNYNAEEMESTLTRLL